jgi:O-antigen/teichoic acid export membrane protein
LLDMGMAPTMNREVARCSASGQLRDAGKLLHTLAVIYWCVAMVIGLVIVILAPFIATHWLNSKDLPDETVVNALMLMGLVVATRWPVGLYQSALIGAQRMTVSSAVNMSMVTLTSVGCVLVLAFVSSTIEAFFAWQALMGLVYAVTLREVTWSVIGKSDTNRFEITELKRIWRFAMGMSAIGMTGLVFSQLDKVILSKVLALEDFGHYMLASVVVSGLYILITPVFNIIFPRFSAFVAKGDLAELKNQYRLGTRLLATILFPLAMFLAIFSEEIVTLWTGDRDLAMTVAPVIALLAAGSALHGVMYFPYALQLANGLTALPLKINLILMAFQVPLVISFANRYGTEGAAAAWLLLHSAYLLLGALLTHQKLLKGYALSWLFKEVGIPLCLTIISGIILGYMRNSGDVTIAIQLLTGVGMVIIVIAASVLISPELRFQISRKFGF